MRSQFSREFLVFHKSSGVSRELLVSQNSSWVSRDLMVSQNSSVISIDLMGSYRDLRETKKKLLLILPAESLILLKQSIDHSLLRI